MTQPSFADDVIAFAENFPDGMLQELGEGRRKSSWFEIQLLKGCRHLNKTGYQNKGNTIEMRGRCDRFWSPGRPRRQDRERNHPENDSVPELHCKRPLRRKLLKVSPSLRLPDVIAQQRTPGKTVTGGKQRNRSEKKGQNLGGG